MFKQVTNDGKVFFEWYDWLKDLVDQLNFETAYKRNVEVEYARILEDRYVV